MIRGCLALSLALICFGCGASDDTSAGSSSGAGAPSTGGASPSATGGHGGSWSEAGATGGDASSAAAGSPGSAGAANGGSPGAAGATGDNTPSFAVGPWSVPTADVGASARWSGGQLTGSLTTSGTSSFDIAKVVPQASSDKARLFLSVPRKHMTNADGTLNVADAEQELDGWNSHIDLDPYFLDQTLVAIIVVDDVDCPACWGGTKPTVSAVESIAKYVKQLWPHARVAMRAEPAWGAPHVWQYMDIAWAQYVGPYRDGTPASYAAAQVKAAKDAKLGLVLGLNLLDGGCGPSSDTVSSSKCLPGVPGTGTWGTYANSPSVHRYQMSAAEVLAYGKAFIAEPYNCAMLGWRYSTNYDCSGSKYTTAQCQGIMQFDSNPDVIAAWNELVQLGRKRSAGVCAMAPA